MNIEVTQAAPQQIEVSTTGIEVNVTTAEAEVEVGNFLPRQQVFMSEEEPDVDFGLWFQTNVDGDPDAIAINIIFDDGE